MAVSMSTGLREYLDATLGTTEGWLCGSIGHGGFFTDARKYRHKEWREYVYRWPHDAERAVRELTQESYLADIYATPYVLTTKERAQNTSVARPLLHSDVDGDLDLDKCTRCTGPWSVRGRM